MEHVSQYGDDRQSVSPAAVHSPVVQCSLAVGRADDPMEHEADAMADRVMQMPANPVVQRKCPTCENEEDEVKVNRKSISSEVSPFIQAKGDEGGAAPAEISSRISATKGGGASLPSGTKSFMESRFGTDFSGVKVHTGDYAAQMSRDLNAHAFTTGNDIYFNSGKFSPETSDGSHLLAHELTHVIQQNGSSKGIQRASINTDGISTDEKKEDVKKAAAAAEKMANHAQMTMGGTGIDRYNKWYDSSYTKDHKANSAEANKRFEFVKRGWVKIYSIFKSRKIVFTEAEAAQKDPTTFAYVYRHDGAYKIFLDGKFWSAALTGKDSKAGTILHELAHEEVYTDDLGYGTQKASALAINDPAKAVNNSDNWEYFAEKQ